MKPMPRCDATERIAVEVEEKVSPRRALDHLDHAALLERWRASGAATHPRVSAAHSLAIATEKGSWGGRGLESTDTMPSDSSLS